MADPRAASSPWFSVRFLGERPGRPPMHTLLCEVALRNLADHPRWFLLPSIVATTWSRPPGGVSSVEVSAYAGQGRVVVGAFLGNGGFRAAKLPAHAEVTLRRFDVPLWQDDLPASVPFEVVAADAVTIVGQPIESWFTADPTSDPRATVEDGTMISARSNPDLAESPVALTGAERRKVELALR